MLVSDRAFHCNDDNVSGFWVSIQTHRGAGDTISQGWTWEKLERVRTGYEFAFFALWFLSSFIAFRAIVRATEKGVNEQIIQPAA